MSSAVYLVIVILISLVPIGCGQMIRESMPPQLGGTGQVVLFEKETQEQTCLVNTKLEYVRYPRGLGSTVGEKFVLKILNHTKQAYNMDVRITGINKNTSEVVTRVVKENALVLPKESGGPQCVDLDRGAGGSGALSGRFSYCLKSDVELPANWREFKWAVEAPNCRAVTAQDDQRVAEPKFILMGVCTSLKPCLPMTFSLESGVLEESKLKSRRKKDGSLRVQLLVKGRLTQGISEPEFNYLSLTFGAGKAECPGTMEGVLPVLGFSAEKHPLIATGSGEFMITDERIAVGCRDCVEFIDPESGSVVLRADSPGRDLAALGYQPEQIGYDDHGMLQVKRIFFDKTSKCILAKQNARFEWGGLFDCAKSKRADGPGVLYSEDRHEASQSIWKNAKSKYLMRIQTGTCP